ncbi:MAG: hypothetical protein D3909_03875 [Candidatus Electrothrix sp. ATG1]|nr:hypothetical protein [Candidatus Electrothrix sp. ATG1]
MQIQIESPVSFVHLLKKDQNFMKFHRLILLTLLFVTHAFIAQSEIIDSCVAVVNEDVITRSDVNRIGEAIFRQINEEAPPEQRKEALEQARKRIIQQLIENKLLTQQAARYNISVTETEIDRAQEQVLQRNNFSDEDFRRELQKMGLSTSQYRETLREQILRSKLINYEVRSKIVIPDEEIQKYFEQQYNEQAQTKGYYILQLGVSFGKNSDTTTKQDARKRVEAAHKLAKEGHDFRELSRKHSNLPSAEDGGDLGFFEKDEMATYMRNAVTTLQPGEISPIIDRPDSYMFFKLLSNGQNDQKNDGKKRVLDEKIKEEIRNKLYKEETEKRYTRWLEKIRSEAYIKIL